MASYYNTSILPLKEGWSNILVSNGKTKTYYYAINKDNKVYLLTYNIGSNAPSDCESVYKDQIINSVKIKLPEAEVNKETSDDKKTNKSSTKK